MGSTESKGQSADTAASKTAEQQENGHVKANGDTLPKTNGDAANGSAEPVTEEAASAETIEQAPPANGEAKPEEPPGKEAKKKRFSFKKNFKLPFRKSKAKDAEAVEAPPAGEEAAAAPKEEEPAQPAEPTSESAEPAETPEAAAPAEEPPAAAVQPEPVVTPPEQTPQSEEAVPSTETPPEPQKEE